MTVQAQRVKGREQVRAKAWGEVRAEAEWAGLLPPDRVEVAYVRLAAQQLRMLPDSLAANQSALSVEQK